MSAILAIVLALVGLLLLIPPLVRLRLAGLRLGSAVLALSRPIDFGQPGPAVFTLTVAGACLAAALMLSGVPARLAGGGLAGPTGAGAALPTPPPPDRIGLTEVDENGRISLRLLQPDTMAGRTVADSVTNFEARARSESLLGPVNSVTCLAFRVAGEENEGGESYRAPGTTDWPRSGYMFCVSHLGMWALSRFDNGIPTYVRPYQEARVIRQTMPNVLAVRAEGSAFTLRINEVEVARVSDPLYASGRLQVTCGTPADATPAAVCHFEAVEVTAAGP